MSGERVRRALLAVDPTSRIRPRPPARPARSTVPPSGHIAGRDGTLRQHRRRAPGAGERAVRGAVGLDYTLNDAEQGLLNKQNINAHPPVPRQARRWCGGHGP